MTSIRLHIRLESEGVDLREWIFDDPTAVTFGSLPSASVWLADPAIGPSRKLFQRKGRKVHFRFASDLTGHLRVGNQDISLAALREAGLLRSDRYGDYVILGKRTTGTISLGSHLFRFWVSDPPQEPEYPSQFQPLVLLRTLQPIALVALFLSFSLHLLVFKGLLMLPPPAGPDIHEVQKRYARFTVPQVNYVKKHLKKSKSTIAAAPHRPEKKPLPPQTTGGFLAAVASSRSKPKSPFSRLFATDVLGKSLNEALKGRSLEDAMTRELQKAATQTDLGEEHSPATIGSLRQKDLAQAKIQAHISGPRVVTLSTESAEVEGSLDRQALERLVKNNSGQLRTCYERSLELNPALSGKVVVSLVVQMDGRPTTIRITDSNMKDPLFRQCIIGRVSTWLFPQPVGAPTAVRFPFIFSAASRG